MLGVHHSFNWELDSGPNQAFWYLFGEQEVLDRQIDASFHAQTEENQRIMAPPQEKLKPWV